MGIDNPNSLQVGINDDCTHKFHAPFLEIPGYQIGKGRACFAGFEDDFAVCKMPQIRKFLKEIGDPFTQYIGIAIDEPVRMERIVNSGNKVSLLEKYGYTEKMAFDLCEKYGLLSPIYEFCPRGGCWFCPNARYAELKHLRDNHRDLWDKLLELENEPDLIGYCWNTLKKQSIHDWFY